MKDIVSARLWLLHRWSRNMPPKGGRSFRKSQAPPGGNAVSSAVARDNGPLTLSKPKTDVEGGSRAGLTSGRKGLGTPTPSEMDWSGLVVS
ncbi:hypothetical protein AOLI_G00053490 [Acnodon oligacanthus]